MIRTDAHLAPRHAASPWVTTAGLLYVAAWVIGLLLEPSSPAPTASAAELVTFYQASGTRSLIQTFLFDGVAGAALLVLAAALRQTIRSADASPLPDLLYGAGLAAASLSLVQGAFGELLVLHAATAATQGNVPLLFDLMNAMDIFKLLALGLFIGAACLLAFRQRTLPRWVAILGLALAPAICVGGLSFLTRSEALYSLLFIVLPLMLVWFLAVSLTGLRRRA